MEERKQSNSITKIESKEEKVGGNIESNEAEKDEKDESNNNKKEKIEEFKESKELKEYNGIERFGNVYSHEFVQEGTSGDIYRAKDKIDGSIRILKVFNRVKKRSRELKFLKHLKGKPGIIELIDHYRWSPSSSMSSIATLPSTKSANDTSSVTINRKAVDVFVLESMDTDLFEYLDDLLEADEVDIDSEEFYLHIRDIMHKILTAMLVCKQEGIIHNDLKLENIFVRVHWNKESKVKSNDSNDSNSNNSGDSNSSSNSNSNNSGDVGKSSQFGKTLEIKIGDFDSAEFPRKRTPFDSTTGTRFYTAPENLLKMGNFDHQSDMWSVGCIFSVLLSTNPFDGASRNIKKLMAKSPGISSHHIMSHREEAAEIFRIVGQPSAAEWPELAELLKIAGLEEREILQKWQGGTNISPSLSAPEQSSSSNLSLSLSFAEFWKNYSEYKCKFQNYLHSPLFHFLYKYFPRIGFLALDLMIRMLTLNPRDRITVEQALAHPYFYG